MNEHRDPYSIPPPPADLYDRIMAAVRSAPPPVRNRRGRVVAIGSAGLAAAAALLLAAVTWFGEDVHDATESATTERADITEPETPIATLWQIPTAEVAAFVAAVDGAGAEATRTAWSLLDQAGSGLRVFAIVEAADEQDAEIRSDLQPGTTHSPAT